MKVATLNRSPSQNQLEPFPRKALYPGALPFVLFIIVAILAFLGTRQDGILGITASPCGPRWCVDNIYPASMAWTGGVRTGDLIMEIDGEATSPATAATSWRDAQSIVIAGDHGELISVQVVIPVIGESPMKWSLWVVAGFFAILGMLVWYRRPELDSAAGLGRMAATASVALAIAPAAGGPQLEWALAIQFVAIAILGFTFFDFVFHLTGEHAPHSRGVIFLRSGLGSLAIVLLISYPVVVFISSDLYRFLMPLLATTLAVSLLASVYVLLTAVIKAPGGSEEDRLRVPLLGMLIGVTPFPLATLVPVALGNDPLAPHLTVLPVILMPSAFAYSILHDQLWGIRRLIHRSLVYGLVSAMVLTIVISGIALSQRLLNGSSSGTSAGDVIAVSIVAFIGISAYAPLRRGVRWVVDRAMYGMTPSYPEFVQGLQRDLASADPDSELPETLSRVLAEHLDLESAILFKHDNEEGQTEVVASVGSGTDRVLEALRERRIAIPTDEQDDRPTVIPFEGEQILRMQLWAAQQHVGTLFLGPKNGGELFIQEEVMLVMNAAPFMAAAIERHEMSQTMRHLARRLVEMDEYSRQRMAVDLHDGPLQKAVALAIGRVSDPEGQREVATELVNELRELSSRLRPSILDDLGLPSSIEWLLEHNMRGTEIKGTLSLEGVEEDQRFDPAVELALFRVTQEAINNAVKHSSATELRVNFELDEEQIALTIKDNGVGIGGTGSGRIPSSRLGMIGMSERVMQVGGHLEVHSWPGRGVFIQATVPMPATEPINNPRSTGVPQPDEVPEPGGLPQAEGNR